MAKLIRCPAGHVYDSQAHDGCPECARTGVLKPAKEDRKALLDEDAGKKDGDGKPSKPLPWLAIGGAAVVLIGVAGFFLFRPAGDDKGETSGGVAVIADAMSDPDFDACRKTVGDDMPACERAITSKKFSGPALAALYSSRGGGHAKKNELDAGIADATEAIKLDPSFVPAFSNRGAMYRSQRKFDDALKDFEQAIKLDPKFPNTYVNRGGLYLDKGDFDLAIADYDRAIQADAKYFRSYWARGDAYFKKGDRERAIADYKQALSLSPDDKTKKLIETALNAATSGAQPSPQAGATPSSGAGADPKSDADYQTCDKGSGDGVVPACDRAIQSGKFSGPALALLYFDRGVERENTKDRDGAIADYTESIKLNPNYFAVLNNRGNLFRGKGQPDEAIADLDKAIALTDKEPLLYSNRGLAYDDKGEHDRAIQDFDEALRRNPNFLNGYINRADAYRKKGDREHASADYDKALSLNPNDAQKQRIESGLNALKDAVAPAVAPANSPAPAAEAENKPSVTPGAADAGKGETQPSTATSPAAAQDSAAADPKSDPDYAACTKSGESTVEICDKAIASGKFSGAALASLYIGRGADQADKKNLDAGIADFTEAIKIDPNRAIAFSNRGALLRQKGERDKALEDLDQAIKLDPRYDSAYNNRGLLYFDKRDYDHAIQDFSQAIALDPDHLKAYANRGDAYRRKGEKALATADYQKALTLNPNDEIKKKINAALYALGSAPPAASIPTSPAPAGPATTPAASDEQTARDHDNCMYGSIEACDRAISSGKFSGRSLGVMFNNRGVARIDRNDLDGAVADLSEAIRVDPTDPRHFVARGNVEFLQGKYDAAIEDYDANIKLNPSDVHLTFEKRGIANTRKGDYDAAIKDFSEEIRLQPNYAWGYENRAYAYWKKGDRERATEDYKTILSIPNLTADYRKTVERFSNELASGANPSSEPELPIELKPAQQAATPSSAPPGAAAPAPTPTSTPAQQTADSNTSPEADYKTCQGHHGDVRSACDRAVASGKFSGPELVELYIDRAIERLGYDDNAGAISDYTEAIRLQPDKLAAIDGRANLYRKTGDYEHAVEDYSNEIKLFPTSTTFNDRGLAYAGMGNYPRAIGDFGKAIELDPKDPKAYKNRGDAYRKKGENQLAKSDYTKALTLDPGDETKTEIETALKELDALGSEAASEQKAAEAASPPAKTPSAPPAKVEKLSAEEVAKMEAEEEDEAAEESALFCDEPREGRKDTIKDCTFAIESGKFSGEKLANLYYLRGLNKEERDDLDGALADYSDSIKTDDTKPGPRYRRGLIFKKKGDTGKASADLKQALELNPYGALLKDIETALRSLEPAAPSEASSAQTAEAKSTPQPQPAASTADPKSDPDYRACSDGTGPEPIPACDRAIASNKFAAKELAELYNSRGFFRLAAKDLDAALTDFSESIRVHPMATAFNNRGVAYRSKREYDLAIKSFDEAIRLEPKDAGYFYHRGIVYKDKGDQDRAIEDFNEVIRLDPKHDGALTYRADAYFTKGDYDHAIKDFDEAIKLDPKDLANYKFRGDAYAKKGDRKQAHDDYAKALSMHPDAEERKVIQDAMKALPPETSGAASDAAPDEEANPQADRDFKICKSSGAAEPCTRAIESGKFSGRELAILYNERGARAYTNEDYDAALADFSEAIRANARNVTALGNRGALYRKMQQLDLAFKDLDQAIQLDAENVFPYISRGFAYVDKGDLDRALDDFSTAIKLEPNEAENYYNRGHAYARKGDRDRAIEDYEKALTLDPGEDTKKDIEQELKALKSGSANKKKSEAPATGFGDDVG